MEGELSARQAALRDKVGELRRGKRTAHYETLVTVLSPSHPSWPVQAEYERAHADWQDAARTLAQIENTVQAESAIAGYRVGREFFDNDILPVVEQLRQVLDKYAALQSEVLAATSARLSDLGRLPMQASKIDEWTQNVKRNFG